MIPGAFSQRSLSLVLSFKFLVIIHCFACVLELPAFFSLLSTKIPLVFNNLLRSLGMEFLSSLKKKRASLLRQSSGALYFYDLLCPSGCACQGYSFCSAGQGKSELQLLAPNGIQHSPGVRAGQRGSSHYLGLTCLE